MACGHAKFTGEVGVCTATSGPGAIHLLNGLYDARLDHQPVVAIVGQQATTALGSHYQQEVDLLSLFKDVAGEYVTMMTTPEQLHVAVDRAHAHRRAPNARSRAWSSRTTCRRRKRSTAPHAFKVVPGQRRHRAARVRVPDPTTISQRPPRCSTRATRWRCSSDRAHATRPTR